MNVRPESARPGSNSGTKSSQAIKKNSLKQVNKKNYDVYKQITLQAESTPDPVPTVSPLHTVQAAFSMPQTNETSMIKHRYSAKSSVNYQEDSTHKHRRSASKVGIHKRSSSAVLDAAIGRSSNYVQNLEPVRQSREINRPMETSNVRSDSRVEDPSKSSAVNSPREALANEMV